MCHSFVMFVWLKDRRRLHLYQFINFLMSFYLFLQELFDGYHLEARTTLRNIIRDISSPYHCLTMSTEREEAHHLFSWYLQTILFILLFWSLYSQTYLALLSSRRCSWRYLFLSLSSRYRKRPSPDDAVGRDWQREPPWEVMPISSDECVEI